MTRDMIIPVLIVGMGSAFLAKTVSTASRTIGLTELPVTHDDMLARDETGETCPGFLVIVQLDAQILFNVFCIKLHEVDCIWFKSLDCGVTSALLNTNCSSSY